MNSSLIISSALSTLSHAVRCGRNRRGTENGENPPKVQALARKKDKPLAPRFFSWLQAVSSSPLLTPVSCFTAVTLGVAAGQLLRNPQFQRTLASIPRTLSLLPTLQQHRRLAVPLGPRPSRWTMHHLACVPMLVHTLTSGDANNVTLVRAEQRSGPVKEHPSRYKIVRITADGRCLFRAVARGYATLRNSDIDEQATADGLRVKVADRLQQQRAKLEWAIEGNFDNYVRRLRRPDFWGGEPELLLLSEILHNPITVYIRDQTGHFIPIQQYGEEFRGKPVRVLYNGRNHYDLLLDNPNAAAG